MRRFPADFLWGAASAAHQVEGGNDQNDWWEWEQQPGRIRGGERSGLACDHARLYAEDFALLASLGHNAHRLSIEWSRVEPRPGEVDPAALRHYRAVLEGLRQYGMEPVVTLHHFTNPRWLARRGAWLSPDAPAAFARFARRVVAEYRDLVRTWVTINEPTVYAYHGFLLGERPPGLRSARAMLRVLGNLAHGHSLAYHAIKAVDPDARVGVAHQRTHLDPSRPGHRLDRLAAGVRLWVMDELYPAMVARGRLLPGRGPTFPPVREDFLGINYYTRGVTRFDPRAVRLGFGREVAGGGPLNALGWEIYPRGLQQVLERTAARWPLVHRGAPLPPIIITENGVPDADDRVRPAFLVQHLAAVHRAMERGVPVRGYLHWSATDNFEWTEGFGPRFGLIEVDYATQRRTPRPSAHLYAAIIRAGGLSDEVLARYGEAEAG